LKYSEIKSIVHKLRCNLTPSEKILWQNLRERKLLGRKFIHQSAIIYENNKDEYFFYVPDFYCREEKLAVELDGKIHKNQIERDQHRDEILNAYGIKVLRFKNEELYDVISVLNRIKAEFCDQEMRYRKTRRNLLPPNT
jgi:very-short-patch-repair endonuclease